MSEKKMRFDNIDIARGLAMLIIISWHTMDIHSPWTDGWVMPIWFFVMGIFYRDELSWRVLAVKKLNTIVVPLLVFSVPSLIILLMEKGMTTALMKLVNPYQCVHPVSWFLWCMLWCYVINWLIGRMFKWRMKAVVVMSLCVTLCGYYMSYVHIAGHRMVLPLFLSTAMTAQGYIIAGRLLSKSILQRMSLKSSFMWSLLAIGGGHLCYPEVQITNWNTYYVAWSVLMFHGITQSVSVIVLCQWLPCIIKYIGRYSLIMLLIHPYVQVFTNALYGWSNFFVVATVSSLTSVVVAHYMPKLSGQKPLIHYSPNKQN